MLSTIDNFLPPELPEIIDDMRLWMKTLPNNPENNRPWNIASLIQAAKQYYSLEEWTVKYGYFLNRDGGHAWLQKQAGSLYSLVLDLRPPNSFGGPLLFLTHPNDVNYMYPPRNWELLESQRQQIETNTQRILDFPRRG